MKVSILMLTRAGIGNRNGRKKSRPHNRARIKSKKEKTGDVLISQAASRQVSSALESLTSVFGMGTGVSSLLLSPDFPLFT